MKRWIIKTEIGTMRLYYDSYEKALLMNPDCEITEDTDVSHLQYIEKILALAVDKPMYYRGYKKVYKIPINDGYVWYHQGEDKESGFLYDYCEYQVWNNSKLIQPICYTISTPKDFYELFCEDADVDDVYELQIYSLEEINKIKPKLTKINKKKNSIWIDDSGYIYEGENIDLRWAKGEKDLWDKFKDNPNCVLIKYGMNSEEWSWKSSWFNSIDEFKAIHKELIEKTTDYYTRPSYKILKTGYSRLQPKQRKCIVKYPYINYDRFVKLSYSNHEIAKVLYNKLKHVRCFQNIDEQWLVDNVVKHVMDYKKSRLWIIRRV